MSGKWVAGSAGSNAFKKGGDWFLNREQKRDFVAEMNSRLHKAQAVFLVDYQGLDVEAMNRIRMELRKAGIEFQVIKNRLLKLATDNTETESLREFLVGPCAMAISYDDLIKPAKILVELSKEHKNLTIQAGQISGKPMDAGGIQKLAQLPGREELIAQVLSAMQGVPTSLVRVLNGVVFNLLNVIKAIEKKKAEQ
jgi:large subunit ribosomal protein L10